MALITYPLNNIEYSAEDAELFHITRESGIYAKNSFDYSVTGADNNIVIGKGIGWIKNGEFSGKVIAQKEAISLDTGTSDPNYARIDAVVIQFDANSNETNIIIKKGVAATNPVAPSVIQTKAVYELHLYHIRRAAGSLYVTPSDIADLRLKKLYCGLMADSVTSIDTAAIEKQVSDLIKSLQSEIASVKDGSAYLPRDAMELLWSNASTTSSFPVQTVSLDLSWHDFVVVRLRTHTGSTSYVYALMRVRAESVANPVYSMANLEAENAAVVVCRRNISPYSAGVKFDNSIAKNTNEISAGVADNSRLVPVEIYGIKGVKM